MPGRVRIRDHEELGSSPRSPPEGGARPEGRAGSGARRSRTRHGGRTNAVRERAATSLLGSCAPIPQALGAVGAGPDDVY